MEQCVASFTRSRSQSGGKPPDRRRDVRKEQTKPQLMALCTWFEVQLARLSPKCGFAQAIRYALGNWIALVRYADDGRLEMG